MHADPFFDTDADGGQFLVIDPDACEAIATRGVHTILKAGLNEGFFEGADIGMQIFAKGA